MHEISLVQNLLEQLEQLAHQNNRKRVIKVTMEIGPLSGIVVDSFQFGFETLTRLKPLTEDAILVVITPAVNYRCTQCGNIISTDKLPESCLLCNESLLLPEGSDDLILKQVEME